jgi:hypothetical protein
MAITNGTLMEAAAAVAIECTSAWVRTLSCVFGVVGGTTAELTVELQLTNRAQQANAQTATIVTATREVDLRLDKWVVVDRMARISCHLFGLFLFSP